MKEARENEKSQSVGKIRLIKGRNLPKEEGGRSMGVLEPQKSQECCRRKERSGNTHKRSGKQEKEEEGSPERLENREEGKRRVKRLLKEV